MGLIFFDMPFYVYIILALTAMVSGIVQFSLGLGYEVVFMAVMPNVINYKLALVTMAVQYMVIVVFSVSSGWKKINMKMATPLMIYMSIW